MRSRPKIAIPLTHIDKILEVIGVTLLVVFWGLALWAYQDLGNSASIPVHFNAQGAVDRYGSKNTLFLLPFIATALYCGLTFLNKYPESFNYLRQVTFENATAEYTKATKMIRLLKTGVVLIMLYIETMIILNAKNIRVGLGKYGVPTIIAMVLIPIVGYLLKNLRKK